MRFAGLLASHTEFRKLWIGSSVSAAGSQVTLLALPLTAVLIFGAGPAETGLLTALGVAPVVVFGLFIGALVDRLPRRRTAIVADLLSAAIIASVPAAALLGSLRLEHLYVATFLAGTCSICRRTSVSAMLPALVGRDKLIDANSQMIVSFSVAQIAGPSIAGVLVQVLSAPLALVVDAASFIFSSVCTTRIRLHEPQTTRHERTSILHEVAQGLAWLYGQPVLFRLAVCIGLANLAWFGVQAVIVVFATRDLGLSPAVLGVALGMVGPATLVGAVLAGRIARRFGLGPTMVFSLTGEFLSRVLLVCAGGSPLVAVLCLGSSQLLFGFIAPLWDVNANSLRQSGTPEHMLGRVSAATSFVGVGLGSVGALLAGWIGEVAGLRVALLATALVTLLAVAVLVRSPVPALRDAATALGSANAA
ncbi:MAG: MFS transporter [Chloroflexi bacterium]|nr:MFS transporter [Chloroflexota bacterium]